MGGKNTCVVLDDAAIRQAVHEVAVGGYLSAGQRCTGTERVLVHRKIADRFIDALARCARELRFGNPEDRERCSPARSPRTARSTKVEAALEAARKGGAEPIVPGAQLARRLLPHARRCTGCPTACTTSPATPTSSCSAPICASR